MEGLDLTSIWNSVMNSTKSSSSSDGSLSNSALSSIAKSIVANMASSNKAATTSKASSSLDYLAIAKQLMTLYNQYKGSSNSTEAAAASNVKQISDIVGAMGGDKGSLISAGMSILGKFFGK